MFGYDDSLDVVGVHLVGGLFGTLALGLFADSTINALVVDEGRFVGGGGTLFVDQLIAAVATIGFSFIVTFIIGKVLDITIGLRSARVTNRPAWTRPSTPKPGTSWTPPESARDERGN